VTQYRGYTSHVSCRHVLNTSGKGSTSPSCRDLNHGQLSMDVSCPSVTFNTPGYARPGVPLPDTTPQRPSPTARRRLLACALLVVTWCVVTCLSRRGRGTCCGPRSRACSSGSRRAPARCAVWVSICAVGRVGGARCGPRAGRVGHTRSSQAGSDGRTGWRAGWRAGVGPGSPAGQLRALMLLALGGLIDGCALPHVLQPNLLLFIWADRPPPGPVLLQA
jgi:hypothetical protein